MFGVKDAGIALEDDYIIKALAIRQMRDEALASFSEYQRNLEALDSNEYVNSELSWTRAMMHKVDVLE